MTRLVVICRVFVSEYMIYRWRVMSRENPDLDITLIGHVEYKSDEFGKGNKDLSLGYVEAERFHYLPVNFNGDKGLLRFGISGIEGWLRLHRPDFVYMIGLETHPIALQIVNIRRKYLPKTKLALFTMRGLDFPKISVKKYTFVIASVRQSKTILR